MKEAHRIERIKINFETNVQDEANFIYSELSDLYRNEAQKIMEEIFEKYNIPGKTINIDRIALSFGEIPIKNIKVEFLNRLKSALTDWFENNFTENIVLPKADD